MCAKITDRIKLSHVHVYMWTESPQDERGLAATRAFMCVTVLSLYHAPPLPYLLFLSKNLLLQVLSQAKPNQELTVKFGTKVKSQ